MSKIHIPLAFEALARPKRIKVFFGGRGSGKSESVARQLLLNAETFPNYSILCARQFQNSIDDSVLSMLGHFVDEYDFDFDVQSTKIITDSGGKITFQGLARNLNSIKSKFGYDVCWIEEAEDVTQGTWDVLLPTIRKGDSEFWITFNPADEVDATYSEFVTPYLDQINEHGFYEDDDIYVAKVNYEQNPFFPDVLRRQSDRLKSSNYKKWLHVYGGEPNVDYEDSLIEPEWFDAAVDAHKKLGFHPRGSRICGYDPADGGKDAKATTFRYGVYIQDVKAWLHGDINTATQLAVDDSLEFNASQLVYDNIGNGSSVKTYATMGGAPERLKFTGFGAGDMPDNPQEFYDNDNRMRSARDGDLTNRDKFKNKRAQYWWLLRDRFFRTWEAVENGVHHDPLSLISINPDMQQLKQLKSELIKVQRKRTPGLKVIQIESKEEMKKRGVPSPNMADSLMMSFADIPERTRKIEHRPPQSRR